MKLRHPDILATLAILGLLVSCGEKGEEFFKKSVAQGQNSESVSVVPPVAEIPGENTPGIPSPDSPTAGSPVSGTPVSGTPVSGTPVSGTPVSGTPVSGTPVSGTPVSGTPVSETPVSGTPNPPAAPGEVVVAPNPNPEKDICEPLKEVGDEMHLGYGLAGKIYDGECQKIQSFKELLQKGKVLEGTIYMSKLDIPTRKFDRGFPREDGTMVLNKQGEVLVENFGIEFTGSFELRPEDEEGYYELGLIADDGVVLDVQNELGELSNVIDADHLTPSKFSCGKDLLRMEKGKAVSLRLRYFQGPKYHISLILMWRKVEPLSYGSSALVRGQLMKPVKETRCGIAGNSFFFDPDSASHPTMEYLDLFDPTRRAVPWKIVQHKNLRLPAGHSNVECVTKKPQ